MIHYPRRTALLIGLAAFVAGCGSSRSDRDATASRVRYANETPELHRLIQKHASRNDVPVDLVQRVVQRESRFNPAARNGPYYGLMQILPETARGMGYRGRPSGLLDADTNLTYAVKYLRGAWIVADGDRDRAVMWYARGYYYEAKRLGLLKETGLRG